MFKWKVRVEAEAKAKPQDVWKYWKDVASWPNWHAELDYCSLDGPFQSGTKGTLKPKGWPPSQFELIEVTNEKSFTDISRMPSTTMVFRHLITPQAGGKISIVHEAEVKGLLAPMLYLTMRRKLKRGMPQSVAKLAALAQAKDQK